MKIGRGQRHSRLCPMVVLPLCDNFSLVRSTNRVKSLIECYGVFLQVGVSDGEGRKDQILQGVSMLMSAANVGTKEGLLLEKIWKGFGGARK